MTELNKKLRREVKRFLELDRFSRGRPIIVELEPPDLISFYWKGTRRRYTASIAWLMQKTIEAAVERDRRARSKSSKRLRRVPRRAAPFQSSGTVAEIRKPLEPLEQLERLEPRRRRA